jgi:hypothetical protein
MVCEVWGSYCGENCCLEVTPCVIVEAYERRRGTCCFHDAGWVSQKTVDAVSSWNVVPNSVLLLLSLKHPVLRAVGNPRCSPRLFRVSSPQCQRSVLATDWIVVLPSALRCGEMQGRCRLGVGIIFILLILWFSRNSVFPGAVRSLRRWSDICGAHCSFSYSWRNTAISGPK